MSEDLKPGELVDPSNISKEKDPFRVEENGKEETSGDGAPRISTGAGEEISDATKGTEEEVKKIQTTGEEVSESTKETWLRLTREAEDSRKGEDISNLPLTHPYWELANAARNFKAKFLDI